MGTAIKVSERLAEEARYAANEADRSLTGQIEHWARLGQAVEPRLSTAAVAWLKKWRGLTPEEEAEEIAKMREAMEGFREMTSEEIRAKLRLDERILYEPDPSRPGGLIRILPDGARQHGFRKGNAFVEG